MFRVSLVPVQCPRYVSWGFFIPSYRSVFSSFCTVDVL